MTGERSVGLGSITGHQRNKPGSARPSLRLVCAPVKPGGKPPAFVLQFQTEADRDVLSDGVKSALSALERAKRARAAEGADSPRGADSRPTAAAGVSPAERAARGALLRSNAELAALHARLVRGVNADDDGKTTREGEMGASTTCGAVTEEEFWSTRHHLLTNAMAKTGATQRPGIPNALDADLKAARDGRSDTVTCALTNDKMHRIFSERPAVRRAFLDNVPNKMTEREFWTRFLRSEYFKAARAGAPPQGEEEAGDLALFSRRPASAAERKNALAGLSSAAVNLAADAHDFGVFGAASGEGTAAREGARGGHGILRDGAKEPPPPTAEEAIRAAKAAAGGGSGGFKAAAAKQAAREVLESLNHHAEVVLRGRSTRAVTDARSAALAAEAQEREGGAAAAMATGGTAGGERKNKNGRCVDDALTVVLDDLVDAEEVPKKVLNISNPQQYFSAGGGGRTAGGAAALEVGASSGAKRNEAAAPPERVAFGEAVKRAARAMGLALGAETSADESPSKRQRGERGAKEEAADAPLSTSQTLRERRQPMVAPATAEEVLRELCASIKRAGGSNADFGSVVGLGGDGANASDAAPPPDVEAKLRGDAALCAELLRHFWATTPMVTPPLWGRAFRVNAALGTLYDSLEGYKRNLSPAARHAVAGRLRPLMAAMDAAFTFYDEEKVRRAAAYDAFDRNRTKGAAGEPIELT